MRLTNCRGDDDNSIEINNECTAPVQGNVCVGVIMNLSQALTEASQEIGVACLKPKQLEAIATCVYGG